MMIAGAMTYGNYIQMLKDGTYRIELAIRRSGEPGAIKAEFDYERATR